MRTSPFSLVTAAVTLCCALFPHAAALGHPKQASGSGQVDQTNPARVVEAVFQAARNRQFSLLAGLCDPLGENDGDTRQICALASNPAGGNEFVSYFSRGRLNGPPQINGTQAQVPFLFGPDGTSTETMSLIQRNGLWYLLGF